MPREIDRAFADLTEFVAGYNLAQSIQEDRLVRHIKSIYRRYHALLVWHADFKNNMLWAENHDKSNQFWAFFSECTSDVCQSFFLFVQGLYKPSYLVLRSAVENFLRCMGIAEEQRVLSISSVYELIAVVGNTDLIVRSASAERAFRKLREIYAELCKHVHTADSAHMSFTSFVGTFPRFEESLALDFSKIARDTLVNMCVVLVILFRDRLYSMHHTHADIIRDAIPVTVRREVS